MRPDRVALPEGDARRNLRPTNFRHEIIWKRTHSHGGANRYGPVHDVILYYGKSDETAWYQQHTPYSDEYVERFFRYEDERGRYRQTILTGSGTRGGESGKPWGGYDPTEAGRHWAVPGYVRDTLGDPPPKGVHTALDAMEERGLVVWPKKARGSGGAPSVRESLRFAAANVDQRVKPLDQTAGSSSSTRRARTRSPTNLTPLAMTSPTSDYAGSVATPMTT